MSWRTVGFASLTMESVAARAKTGVAVLYRRWPNKDDLVMAAIEHYRRTHRLETPDTGTLRGDLLALLGDFSDGRSGFTAVMTATFAGLQADSGLTPAEVRARIIDDRPISSSTRSTAAPTSAARSISTASPSAVLSMPFDLMRHDLLMTLPPGSPRSGSSRSSTTSSSRWRPSSGSSRPRRARS